MSDLVPSYRGCLVGVLVGDSVGARAEGAGLSVLRDRYRNLDSLIKERPGRYSCVSEMSLAVAESLALAGGFDGEDMSRRLVLMRGEERGYGQGTEAALERIADGLEWNEAALGEAGRGCAGNAAAARSAAVGLAAGTDLDRLRFLAEETASITHDQSIAAEAAVVYSLATALGAATFGRTIDPVRWLERLHTEANVRELKHRLETAADLIGKEPSAETLVMRLGNNATALGSVVTAIFCFLSHPDDFAEAVASAAMLGGNATSITAMTGGLAGAHLGEDAMPETWTSRLEKGAVTTEKMRAAADALTRLHA